MNCTGEVIAAMNAKYRRLSMRLAISAAVALVTPAAAAGLVEGVSVAATTVADATAPNQAAYQDQGGEAGKNAVPVATHAPTRLSALAGNDDAAWAEVGRPAPERGKPR
jgi:hypothetical protein